MTPATQDAPQDAIRFLGHRTDIPDLLASADLLCFPSLSDGRPGTLIEAMGVGCPIVASNIPANLEGAWATRHRKGSCGPGNPQALADALSAALTGPHRMGLLADAPARFINYYSVDEVASRMGDFFVAASHTGKMRLHP